VLAEAARCFSNIFFKLEGALADFDEDVLMEDGFPDPLVAAAGANVCCFLNASFNLFCLLVTIWMPCLEEGFTITTMSSSSDEDSLLLAAEERLAVFNLASIDEFDLLY
jgi:hypothetical protein